MRYGSANIWGFQQTLTRRLFIWSGLSIIVGLGLLGLDSFWRGFGIQALAWGLIDAAIAFFGGLTARRRYAALPDPLAPVCVRNESQKLRRLLWVNAGLDVGYMAGGLALALTLGANDPAWQGHGWGIVAQGGFLFLFDLYHAWIIRER
jgi:hypothetical protein